MSSRYQLTDQELDDLEFEHRHTTDKRYADRVKTVYLLGKGWSVTKISEALLIDRETVRNHFKRYRKGGLTTLQRNDAGGSDAALTEEQRQALDQHLRACLYLTAKEIAHYVEQTWQVTYSESGMTQLLHRLGYVYKKPKLIPGKANAGQQRGFVERYQILKAEKASGDPIYCPVFFWSKTFAFRRKKAIQLVVTQFFIIGTILFGHLNIDTRFCEEKYENEFVQLFAKFVRRWA